MAKHRFIALDFTYENLSLPSQLVCPHTENSQFAGESRLQSFPSLISLSLDEHAECFNYECISRQSTWPAFEGIAAAGAALHHERCNDQIAEWQLCWDAGDERKFFVRTQKAGIASYSVSMRVNVPVVALADYAYDDHDFIPDELFGFAQGEFDSLRAISVHTVVDETFAIALSKGVLKTDLTDIRAVTAQDAFPFHSRVILVDRFNMIAKIYCHAGSILDWDLDAIVCLHQFIIANPGLIAPLERFRLLDNKGEHSPRGVEFEIHCDGSWWLRADVNVSAVGELL